MSNTIQRSFTAGEVSPSLYARADQIRYATGLKTLRNFVVQRHGGVSNRPGTGFIGEVKDSTKRVRLVPFVTSTGQSFILEFGHHYIRVYENKALVFEPGSFIISGVSNANPCVIALSSAPLLWVTGDQVRIQDLPEIPELNNRTFILVQLTATTYSLKYTDGTDVDSTDFGSYVSTGLIDKIFEKVTTYDEADLMDLQFTQSGTVTLYGFAFSSMLIVHPSYPIRQFVADPGWTFQAFTIGPTILNPAFSAVQQGAAVSTTYNYKLTSVSATTSEESLPSGIVTVANGNQVLNATNHILITITTPVTEAAFYNVYKELNGQYGWIGIFSGTTFKDIGYTPDPLDTPPVARDPFSGANNYPAAITFYQQRLILGGSNNNSDVVFASKSALYKNFCISTPLQDDDAVTFAIVGRRVNRIKHLIDVGRLVVLTVTGEWVIEGDAGGVLTPTSISPRQHSENGSGGLRPLVVNGSAIFLQARGRVVRDLLFDYQVDGYRGNDLSIFASHLLKFETIVDWEYQQNPNSTVWAVRSDGVLLGMTYIKEQEINGWHRHDFDGTCENVCVIQNGTQDEVYLVIKREIDGREVRYIEYFKDRDVEDITDLVLMDSALSYDGTNTDDSHTMTLSGGLEWTYEDVLILTSSDAFFLSSDIGNVIHLTGDNGEVIRLQIYGFTDSQTVTGHAHKTVPESMRGAATSTWARAVDQVGDLWHLEGKQVSVFADGFVVANPAREVYPVLTVTDGVISFDKCYIKIHVGLPITSDFETLDIDFPGGQSISDKKKNIGQVTLFVESTRAIFAGPDEDHLTEFKLRTDETYDEPTRPITGTVSVNIQSQWRSNGSIFVRNTDPVPCTILACVPSGYLA